MDAQCNNSTECVCNAHFIGDGLQCFGALLVAAAIVVLHVHARFAVRALSLALGLILSTHDPLCMITQQNDVVHRIWSCLPAPLW